MRGLRLLLLCLAGREACGWVVFAGGDASSMPDLTNVTTAMESAYRFSARRPFLKWALAPEQRLCHRDGRRTDRRSTRCLVTCCSSP